MNEWVTTPVTPLGNPILGGESGIQKWVGVAQHTESAKTQFLAADENWVDAIFKEFRELDSAQSDEPTAEEEDPKTKRLKLFLKISDIAFKILLIGVFFTGIDSTLRAMNDAGYLADVGVCGYIGYGISHENSECQTYAARKITADASEESMKAEYSALLDTFVEREIWVRHIADSAEVQFIRRKTEGGRVAITKMSKDFTALREAATPLRGLDIECWKTELTEQWTLKSVCNFYGNALNSGSPETTTSRATVLNFLAKVNEQGAAFSMVNLPQSLWIEKYSSLDLGTKGTFSTKTSMDVNLRYVNPNQP